jgi:intracellular septation protein A
MIEQVIVSVVVFMVLLFAWLWRPGGIERGVWLLLACYALLGAWALWFGVYAEPGEEPAGFAFWKPTVLYWTLTLVLIVAPLLGWGYPIKAILGTYFVLTPRVWGRVNWGFAAIFGVLGGINLLLVFKASGGSWEGFKYSCLVNMLFIIMLRLNFVWGEIVSRMVVFVYRKYKTLVP